MSLHQPTFMEFGAAVRVISPDGSGVIPPELWAEFACLTLVEPAPALLAEWIRGLEDRLGVTPDHRRELRGQAFSAAHPWSILCVSPQMERKVEQTLRENGLSVYVPVEKYRPANTWRHRTRPLMPGYIFADLCDDRALDLARANHAVRQVMCKEGRPVKVPAVMIGTMILLEAWRMFDQTWKPSGASRNKRRGRRGVAEPSRWKSGQRVKVAEGPFAGFIATVLRADRENRVEVLISIFGRESAVELDETAIEGGEG